MRERIPKPSGPFPGAKGNMTRLAYARAKQAGIELYPLLRKAQLREKQIQDVGARLGVRNQILFLNLVSDALSDKLLGFHLGQLPDLREIGLLYYVATSSELLIDALRRAARYGKIVNEGIAMEFIEGNEIAIRFNYVGVARHLDRHQIEAVVTVLVRLYRHLTGQRSLPARAKFTHPRSGDTSAIDRFLGCGAEFGAEVDEVAFPTANARMNIVGADPYLNKLLVAQFEEALLQRPSTQGEFQSNVENAIARLLPHGQARAGEVSRRLGVSQRTLVRRLSSEGLTFSEVVKNLRASLAERHLKDQSLSISQVAWLLGYREVSAFTHAFKRWTGKTPRVVRGELNSGQ